MEQTFLTPAQRKAQVINQLKSKASSVEREGLDFLQMEQGVPYLLMLGNVYGYTTKAGENEDVADVTDVTTGEVGQLWLAKTRLKNIVNEWQTKIDACNKKQVVLLELTDQGLQEADVKGGQARAYKKAFVTIDRDNITA